MKHRLAAALIAALALVGAGCGTTQPPPALHQAAPLAHAYMGYNHPPNWGAPQPSVGARLAPAAQTAEMFDTVTIGTIPSGARFLAGYDDGLYQTFWPLTRLPWHPVVKSIAVFPWDRGNCLDVEPSDATPSQAPGWWAVERGHGVTRPCIYSSLWEFTHQVIPALNAAGIPRSDYWAWDADYTYRQHLDSGFDATQWTDRALNRNLDESTATLAFLGVQPQPQHPVIQPPKPGLNYAVLTPTERGYVLRYDGARKHLNRYGQYVAHVLEPKLGELAHVIYILAHGHGNAWLQHNRWVRFPELYNRSLGQQFAK